MSQELSLVISLIFFIVAIIQIKLSLESAKWIYIVYSLGWLGGIIYHSGILFFDFSHWHTLSSALIIYQKLMFGTWTVITLFEKLKADKSFIKIKTRMVSWIINLSQALSHRF